MTHVMHEVKWSFSTKRNELEETSIDCNNNRVQKEQEKHMDNVERRLELIKMMRNEQVENIGRIRKRERILYPERKLSYIEETDSVRTFGFSDRYADNDESRINIHPKSDYGFYMRLGICMGLFFVFVYMETKNISYFGISHEQIQTAIAETIDVNSFAFMEQFPYTLEE